MHCIASRSQSTPWTAKIGRQEKGAIPLSKVQVDGDLAEQLAAAKGDVFIMDAQERVLGQFSRSGRRSSTWRKVVISSDLVDRFGALTEIASIVDSDDLPLGTLEPFPSKPHISSLQLDPPISAEEIARRRQCKTGKTLEEVLASLRS